MTNGINTRELILQILLEIEEEGKHSHIAIRNALSKYQFLPRQERAFITRVCEGTLEYRILIDYIIDSYSKVSVDKMKPVIREILRSAVYQRRAFRGQHSSRFLPDHRLSQGSSPSR